MPSMVEMFRHCRKLWKGAEGESEQPERTHSHETKEVNWHPIKDNLSLVHFVVVVGSHVVFLTGQAAQQKSVGNAEAE